MMTLEDAVNLSLFAVQNGKQGDIFVQKAPATSIGVLTSAVKEYKKSNANIEIIGARPGEKISEVIVTKEEMSKATLIDNYFIIKADKQNNNEIKEEYTSLNAKQLDVKEMIEILKKI